MAAPVLEISGLRFVPVVRREGPAEAQVPVGPGAHRDVVLGPWLPQVVQGAVGPGGGLSMVHVRRSGEVVSDVLALYERIAELENRLTAREMELRDLQSVSAEPTGIEAKVLGYGRRKLYEDCTWRGNEWLEVGRDVNGDVVVETPYESFLGEHVRDGEIPHWLSHDDFLEVCRPELMAAYEQAVQRSIDRFVEGEGGQ